MKTFLKILFFFLLVTQICIAQWLQQNSGTSAKLNNVCFENLNNGWIVGDSGIILHTTNGGADWITESSGTTYNLLAVSFFDESKGIIVGGNWDPNLGIILRTTDGGLNWLIDSIGIFPTLTGISIVNASIGTIVGGSGTILRTTNGGESWISQQSGTSESLFGVSFTDANNGIVLGQFEALKTTDGGQNWFAQPHQISAFIYAVTLTAANHGFVVGSTKVMSRPNSKFILRTTDGGLSWNSVCGGIGGVHGIWFSDINYGISVGYVYNNDLNLIGEILKSTDGGETWVSQSLITTSPLLGVCFIDAFNGWVVGENGTILHTTNGGVTFIEEEQNDFTLPAEFLLSQNYPNPFNPSTTLSYSIPNESKVLIKVYNILGSEIETLVNEDKTAGTYELTWNAANPPSGVYFYQLRAGNFVKTKKMLLLK